jgi:hypothetical protein
MEQIVQALNEIKNVIEGDRFTVVMSGILAVTPIILTIITIWLSVRMDKQSKKLQKELADRDQKNQTRSCVLDIYNTYLSAFHMTGQATGNISEIFVSDQSYYKWALEVEENSKNIMSAYNRAKLMLKDEVLINELKKGFEAFSILNGSVKSYIFSGLPTQTIQNAWKTSRASFEVSMRNNELRYNAGATWEADRILKELPETLEAHKSRDWVVMNLDEAKEFFGVDFKTSFISRLLKK